MRLLRGVKKLKDNVATRRGLCLLLVVAPLLAQTSRGTVAGTVTDTFDARIAAAPVTLTNTETGVSQTTAANPAGLYRFDAVDLGLYNLKVTHRGFKVFTGVGFRVAVNRTTTIDPRLELGDVKTSVEVTAESADLRPSLLESGLVLAAPPAVPESPTISPVPFLISNNDVEVGGTAGEPGINVQRVGGRVRMERNVITTAAASPALRPVAMRIVGSGSYRIAHNSINCRLVGGGRANALVFGVRK